MKANPGKCHLLLTGNDYSTSQSEIKQFPEVYAKNF